MSKRKYDRGTRRRMRLYEDHANPYRCRIRELIEAKCLTDPEFKKAWEEHQNAEEGFFKDTMKGLCEAIVIEEEER